MAALWPQQLLSWLRLNPQLPMPSHFNKQFFGGDYQMMLHINNTVLQIFDKKFLFSCLLV
jgi:hypothetical protein